MYTPHWKVRGIIAPAPARHRRHNPRSAAHPLSLIAKAPDEDTSTHGNPIGPARGIAIGIGLSLLAWGILFIAVFG